MTLEKKLGDIENYLKLWEKDLKDSSRVAGVIAKIHEYLSRWDREIKEPLRQITKHVTGV